MKSIYQIHTNSKSNKESVFIKDKLRISFITERLIRVEWNNDKNFIDEPTQKVWNRNLKPVSFKQTEVQSVIILETDFIKVFVRPENLLRKCVKVELKNSKASWFYGKKLQNLKGTTRTLDVADGEIPLEDGMISKQGITVLDDSSSFLILDNGELKERKSGSIDLYVFLYGKDYKACIQDFLQLTGGVPLLPRYALGNWWSRFHVYTEEEFEKLISDFEENKIPLCVSVIDMDWHPTKIDKDIGSGWTGYSWNKSLFPDPERFLHWLHQHNLKVSLNVHPAEGVGRHEDAYKNMIKALNLPEDGKTIPFDIAEPVFVENYFKYLHYPLEEQGVDFWWIDWQQGKKTKKAGLDPLWVLNHYHTLDNAKNGKRPLILSRYAGPGSQRYPLGFSGDAIISWKSLKFQPYFTANATNIGYGWWSHDIGGHMMGTYDEELQIRWVQQGVFSPINRLHSSASPFNHKEPWNYSPTANKIVSDFLRLRHRLIPYLYSMNYRSHSENLPLIMPLYYEYPENEKCYEYKNEYFFGSELICAPVTDKIDPVLKMAKVKVWLPQGNFTDLSTGLSYNVENPEGQEINMYRNLETLPILAKKGAIIPLSDLSDLNNGTSNPKVLDIYIVPGADGEFTLYEDDGESSKYADGDYVLTKFSYNHAEKSFTIHQPVGNLELLPDLRKLNIHFINTDKPLDIQVICNAESHFVEIAYFHEKPEKQYIFELLDKMKCDYYKKEQIFDAYNNSKSKDDFVKALKKLKTSSTIIEALTERMR